MARLPLRLQLTLWFLTIFASIYLGLSATFWFIGRRSQQHILDDGLISLADGVATLLVKFEGDMSNVDLRPYQPVDREFSLLALRDSTGAVLAHDLRVEVSALPPVPADSTVNMITALAGETARSLVGRAIATRMVTHRLVSRKGGVYYMDVARTTDVGRRQRLFFSDVLFIAGIGGLLSSTFVAWVLLGRATNPILRLAEAASRVGPGETLPRDSTGEEIERLRTALNDALARLEQGYRERQQFLANVAHDLKTPVSVMLTQSQVLNPQEESPAVLQDYRASIMEELQRLRGIIDGILTLSRAEQGEGMLRRTMLDIDAIVEQSASRCRAQATASGVGLATAFHAPGSTVYGDIDLLSTMMDNLVRNAIRFSPRGATVDVRVARAGHNAQVSVRDHGPGIPSEFVGRIFERFVQVPGSAPHGHGTGLGLAIVKAVCEAHGGSVAVRNLDDGGCQFVVTLPLMA